MSAKRLGVTFAFLAILLAQVAGAADSEAEKMAALARDLKSKDAKVRVKSAEGFWEFGPKAADYAKDLCDALLDSDPAVAKVALKALGRVRPELHRSIAQFLDKSLKTRAVGAKALAALGADAEPTAYFIAKNLAASVAKDGKPPGPFEAEVYAALLRIGSEEPEVIDVLKSLAGPGKPAGHRVKALEVLADWAAGNDDRRKELLPLIKSGLETAGLEAACCSYAARYGALSRDLLPLLKPLLFSRDPAVREEAEKAVAAVEAAIKKQ